MTPEQFCDVVTQYEKLVYSICYQFTHDHYTAEDLAQEAFVSAYRHIDDCPEEAFRPWLARIATNKAKDYLKSAYNRRVQTPGEEGLPEGKTVLFAADERPEDITIGNEEMEMLRGEILSLKEPYHMVAVSYFLEERTVEEIAKQLDRPTKTVHTQLYRAKNILKEKLKGGR